MIIADIIWRCIAWQGHDACRIEELQDGWRLNGTAVFRENDHVSNIAYDVRHDSNWVVQSAEINGWSGPVHLDLDIQRGSGGHWTANGNKVDRIDQCSDVDLGFTPATNTSAIKRLDLAVGEHKQTLAAWLDPADWQLKPLEQTYRRRSDYVYVYESPAHGFHSELTVAESGLVQRYPDLWISEG